MTIEELTKQRDAKRAVGDVAYSDYLQTQIDNQSTVNPAYNVQGIGNGTWQSQAQKDAEERQLSSSSNPYQSAQNETDKRLASMRQNQIGSVNDTYSGLQKEAYITKMQSEGSLPAVLAATGRTGGMAETTAAAPTVAYQNALSEYGKSKADAINKINMANDEQALQIAVDFADKIINQQNIDRSFSYQAGRDTLSDQRYTDETAYNRNTYADETAYNRNNYADETAYNRSASKSDTDYTRAAQVAQASGDYSIMKNFGWSDDEVSKANYNLQAATAAKSTSGGSSSSKVTNSASYSSILKNAKALAAVGNVDGAVSYLDKMVDSGYITPEEAVGIYQVELSATPATSSSSDSGITTYEDYVQATKDSSIYTQAEFSRRKASNSGGTSQYATYQDYLNAMYKKYN